MFLIACMIIGLFFEGAKVSEFDSLFSDSPAETVEPAAPVAEGETVVADEDTSIKE